MEKRQLYTRIMFLIVGPLLVLTVFLKQGRPFEQSAFLAVCTVLLLVAYYFAIDAMKVRERNARYYRTGYESASKLLRQAPADYYDPTAAANARRAIAQQVMLYKGEGLRQFVRGAEAAVVKYEREHGAP